MRLIECYVSSFGKLKDYSYKFNDGLNVINEENGFGKTTFTYFLKAMFYGLNDSKHSIEENERKRFKPWNSTQAFGGYLVFEKDGKNYKIQRFFGVKSSEDESVLTDLSTGKTFENPGDIGNKIFEIDEQGFLSTTFFSQKDISVKSSYSLTAKFNDICDVQDDTSFDNALALVKNKIKIYKYSGQRGLIPQTQNDIFEIEKNIHALERSVAEIEELTKEKNSLTSQSEIVSKNVKSLTERLSIAAEKESFAKNKSLLDKLTLEGEQLVKKREDILTSLNNNVPTEQELMACKDCIDDLQRLNDKEKALNADLDQLSPVLNQKQTVKTKGKISYISLIGAIVFLFGIGLTFVNTIISTVLMCVGATLEVVSLITKKKDNDASLQSVKELYKAKKQQIDDIFGLKQDCSQSIEVFLCKFNLTFDDPYVKLEEVKKRLGELRMLEREILSNEQSISSLGFQKGMNFDKEEELSVEDLQKLIEQNNEQINFLSTKIIKIQSTLKEKENDIQSIDYLSGKLRELKENLSFYIQDYNALTLTQEYLEKAEENLKIRYKEPLQKSFDNYLSSITESLKKADIDIDFKVKVAENGISQAVEYYSQGFRDIFDICKRFALIEVLYIKEKPFLILDDPFCNLDNQKLQLALDLVEKLSKNYQVVYFSCHQSRVR